MTVSTKLGCPWTPPRRDWRSFLTQYGQNWRPVVYTSQTLVKSECHYAQIEKVALASVQGCKKSLFMGSLWLLNLMISHISPF